MTVAVIVEDTRLKLVGYDNVVVRIVRVQEGCGQKFDGGLVALPIGRLAVKLAIKLKFRSTESSKFIMRRTIVSTRMVGKGYPMDPGSRPQRNGFTNLL
jgi:hypothetical protein